MPLPLYAKCPTCRGNRFVSAIVEMGDGFRSTRMGEFACLDCGMTGEADMDRIMEIAADENERREMEI
jgi:hypothetical protein